MVTALLCASYGFSQEANVEIRVPDGYQGFIEQENRFHLWGEEKKKNSVALSTTHGFYFNGHTFVGIGIGLDGSGDHVILPFYTAIKHVFLNDRSVSPVVGVRMGSYIGDDLGTYADLSAGVRFATKRDFALSISLAASYSEPFYEYDYEWNADYSTSIEKKNKIDFSGISLRFGVEW